VALGDHDGVVEQVRYVNQSRRVLFADIPAFSASDSSGAVAVAYQWTTGMADEIHSSVNGTATPAGGRHVEGFKKALTRSVNECARPQMADPLSEELLGSDIREGLTAVIAVEIENPEFGPMGRFESLGIRRLVERITKQQIKDWMRSNPNEAELVRRKAMAARHRRESARRHRPGDG
jgi:DNA gyrase subunit B